MHFLSVRNRYNAVGDNLRWKMGKHNKICRKAYQKRRKSQQISQTERSILDIIVMMNFYHDSCDCLMDFLNSVLDNMLHKDTSK